MNDFPELKELLCKNDYDWLSENYPDYIDAINKSMKRGKTPREIYLFLMNVSPSRQAGWVRIRNAAEAIGEGWR